MSRSVVAFRPATVVGPAVYPTNPGKEVSQNPGELVPEASYEKNWIQAV